MILEIITPAGKRPIRSTLRFFPPGNKKPKEVNGNSENNNPEFLKLLKIKAFIASSPRSGEPKTVKVMPVVELGKIYKSEATALQFTNLKIFFKKN